jgi:hypothetical protein
MQTPLAPEKNAENDAITAGVYWDVQDLTLSDLDRIEVIPDPGGSIWGPNSFVKTIFRFRIK